MDDMTRDKNKENFPVYEIPDEVVETAACIRNEKTNNFTQWVCTALYFCPALSGLAVK